MARRNTRRLLDNLCEVSADMSRRILTCERKGRESAKVGYEDLVAWQDAVADAIEEINERGDMK